MRNRAATWPATDRRHVAHPSLRYTMIHPNQEQIGLTRLAGTSTKCANLPRIPVSLLHDHGIPSSPLQEPSGTQAFHRVDEEIYQKPWLLMAGGFNPFENMSQPTNQCLPGEKLKNVLKPQLFPEKRDNPAG